MTLSVQATGGGLSYQWESKALGGSAFSPISGATSSTYTTAPVTLADVKAVARDCWKAVSSGGDSPTKAAVDILGWEFAFELNELAKQIAAEALPFPAAVFDVVTCNGVLHHIEDIGRVLAEIRRVLRHV